MSKDMLDKLSNREQEVLRLAVSGYSNKAIAEILIISTYTVKAHLDHITVKLDAKSHRHAVAIGAKML